MTRHTTSALLVAVPLGVVLALAGCSSGGQSSGSADYEAPQSAASSADLAQAPGMDGTEAESNDAGRTDAGGTEATAPGAADPATDPTRDIIVTGEIDIVCDDPIAAADGATEIASQLGGFVESRQDRAATQDRAAWARVVLRIPSGDVGEASVALKALGDVSNEDWGREDVTAQVVDLDARIATLRTSIDRLRELMASASDMDDVIRIEQELTHRQSTLESTLSTRATLGEQVSYATITLFFDTPETAITVTRTGFVGALQRGTDALVDFGAGVLAGLGYALPWLAVLAVLVALVVMVLRWRRRHAASRPTAATPLTAAPATTLAGPAATLPAVAQSATVPPPSQPATVTPTREENESPVEEQGD